jgi:hypothetical protein
MASSGKKKTTMAKLNRESRLRERRVEKKARKERRKLAAADPDRFGDTLTENPADPDQLGDTRTENTADADSPDYVPAVGS